MSFREDFLEALSSVKRDFFRDTEYTGPAKNAAGEEKSGRQPQVVENVPPPVQPDEEVRETFFQASVIDDRPDDDADLDGNIPLGSEASASAAPFRSFEPVAGGGYPPNGRGIFDFEEGGVYSDDKTVISKNTVIRGALHTEDSLRLLGQIHGDIECKSNVVLAGKVQGNTAAANAYIFDAQIDGDVRCDDAVNISSDAWVLGNVRAQQAEIDGKIKGNIEVRHSISIGSTSSILGDISTDELEIKRGAFVNGQIVMYSPSRDVLDRFDRFED